MGLMEREGSGFDLMYDRMLSTGRPAPLITEGPDSVRVTIFRRIVRPQVIRLMEEADKRFHLTQRERITLGGLAQSEGMTAKELSVLLELGGMDELKSWFGRLPRLDLVQSSGRTQGKRYFLAPALLRDADLDLSTTLTRIEPHRLKALILEDLRRYPESKIGEVHQRIGMEINRSKLKRMLAVLVDEGKLLMDGVRGGARYRISDRE